MIKSLITLFFIVLIPFNSQAKSSNEAYVLKLNPKTANQIVKFDINNDEILEKISIPTGKGFNNFLVDEKGGCYISNFRYGKWHGREIYYYDSQKKKLKKFSKLRSSFGPSRLFMTDKDIIVQVEGNRRSRNRGGILFIDKEKGRVRDSIFIKEFDPEYSQADIVNVFFDGRKYILLTTFYMPSVDTVEELHKTDASGDIYIINTDTKKVEKVINVSANYRHLDGLCKVGDKIYLTAMATGKRKSNGLLGHNTEVLVYSFKTGKLIKKIPVSPLPCDIFYDESVGKLYVQHIGGNDFTNKIEVVDQKTNKVINILKVSSQLDLSVVKSGKIYMSVGRSLMRESKTRPRLMVLDTKTDKIIKEFEGSYKGVSRR